MAIDAGSLVAHVVSDIGGLTSGLKKGALQIKQFSAETNTSLKSWTETNKAQFKALGVAVGAFAVAAGIALKKVSGEAIKAASDLEETTAKFVTVFGSQAEEMDKVTQELRKGYAMSTEEARKNLAAVQDLLVPMGMNKKEAAGLSSEIVKLTADLGSFNNLPTADVMRDVQSALTGEFQTMKKYGVVLNAANVEQEVFNLGLAKTKDDITAADKAQAAYNLVVKGSQAAIGDMSRTQDSYANVTKKTQALQKDFLAALGKQFLPMATQAKQKLIEWAEASGGVGEKARTVAIFIVQGMKAITNAFQGFKILGEAAILSVAVRIEKFLVPLSLMLDGLQKIGVIDFNPLTLFVESAKEGLRETVEETEALNEKFDNLISTLRTAKEENVFKIKPAIEGEDDEGDEDGVDKAMKFLTGATVSEFEEALLTWDGIKQTFADSELVRAEEAVRTAKTSEEKKIAIQKGAATLAATTAQNLTKILGKESKAAFLIMQAAKVAESIVNAWAAHNLALAVIPPPFNIAVANVVLGIGLAAAATEAAVGIQGFQEGGVTLGAGRQDTIGPAMLRPNEVIAPLEKLPDLIPKIVVPGLAEGATTGKGEINITFSNYGNIRTEQDKDALFQEMADMIIENVRGEI